MSFELEQILFDTEDFLLRTLGSGNVRQARKRRAQRTWREGLRRVRRAAWLLALSLVALVAASIVLDFGVFTGFVALPTAFFVAFLSLFWPSKAAAETVFSPATAPLEEIAIRAADGLLDRCDELPGRAIASADRIIGRLHELAPHLASLDANDPACGDARRLICQHLPKLVDTYLDLPPSLRAPGAEATERFGESLNIVANEFDSLLDRCCRDIQLGFETQHRFIESRYSDGGPRPA